MTLKEAQAEVARRLSAAGVDSARLDARLLLAEAIGVDSAYIFSYPERVLDAAESERLEALVARREAREPLARILGVREFWSLPFRVSADTLVPRPDTETVVEAVLEAVEDREAALRLLDLGTGSGCLLLALLSELPQAEGVGVDLNPGALAVAGDNAVALGLSDRARFVEGSWDTEVGGPFDLVVSNPPYIPDADIPGLMPEVVEWEPRLALAGGEDGLDSYRAIARRLPNLLRPGGAAFFEVGVGQDRGVAGLLQEAGAQSIVIKRDLPGVPRCVGGLW